MGNPIDKLVKVLEKNPGAVIILDNDAFWIAKTIDTGDDHWADVPGNELYESQSENTMRLNLIEAFAILNGMEIELV